MKVKLILLFLIIFLPSLYSKEYEGTTKEVTLKLIETTDVHGNFFSYDFINNRPLDGGLSHVASYVKEQRSLLGDDLCLLFDAGDILQGQPCVYYTNFIDTLNTHLTSDMMNFMGYDAACFGNHDIEAGHPAFDRWTNDSSFPILGANILSVTNNQPYAKPYCIFEREGVKIAVLGMITPAIPMWLPETLWSGLRFEDMVACARKWIPLIQETEKPDILVGLFHTGLKGAGINGFNENTAEEIALTIPGIDLIFYGHDHRGHCQEVTNRISGKPVWLLNAGGETNHVAEASLTFSIKDGKVTGRQIKGSLVSMDAYKPDSAFTANYKEKWEEVQAFVSERIGSLAKPIETLDYFFGPSAMADLLHHAQLSQVEADISLVTPLTFNEVINAGDIYVKDIFKLYRYENRINVFQLTGKEIVGALERSYSLWSRTMASPEEHALPIRYREEKRAQLDAPTFYLLSAAGISYEVDLTQPNGEKVKITRMKDGTDFQTDKTYRVAVNSYIGSGGGGLLTEGSGITLEDLPSRIIATSDKDLRNYVIEYFRRHHSPVEVLPLSDWKFVPENLVKEALERDRKILSDN